MRDTDDFDAQHAFTDSLTPPSSCSGFVTDGEHRRHQQHCEKIPEITRPIGAVGEGGMNTASTNGRELHAPPTENTENDAVHHSCGKPTQRLCQLDRFAGGKLCSALRETGRAVGVRIGRRPGPAIRAHRSVSWILGVTLRNRREQSAEAHCVMTSVPAARSCQPWYTRSKHQARITPPNATNGPMKGMSAGIKPGIAQRPNDLPQPGTPPFAALMTLMPVIRLPSVWPQSAVNVTS